MFPEYTYAQSMVTGALFQKMDESACDPELLGILRRLLLSSNSNDLEYRALD